MLRPQVYKAKVKEKSLETWKVTKLTLSYVIPAEMEFVPGQFINLKCPGGKFRAYSICSSNSFKNELFILVETGHVGVGSNYVRDLKIGDEVEFIGPSGKLSLYEPLPAHAIFLATGTGLAPYMSMFNRMIEIGYQGKIDLFFGARAEKEVLQLNELKEIAAKLLNFHYEIYISQPETNDLGKTGRITDDLEQHIDLVARYFVCGHPAMVAQVKELLEQHNIPDEQIIVEGFTRNN